jgi:hypothetical protein
MGSTNNYATRGTVNIFPARMPFSFPMMSLPQHHEVLAAANSGPYVSPVYIINFHTYKQEVEDTVLSLQTLRITPGTHVTRALHGPKRRLMLGHGCAPGPSTARISHGQRAGPGFGQGRAWLGSLARGRAPLKGAGEARATSHTRLGASDDRAYCSPS